MPNFKYIGGAGAPDAGTIFGLDVVKGGVIALDDDHEAFERVKAHRWFESTTDKAESRTVSRETQAESVQVAATESQVAEPVRRGPRKGKMNASGLMGEIPDALPPAEEPTIQ
jgi:hypothetical protein